MGKEPPFCQNPNCDGKTMIPLHPTDHDELGDVLIDNYYFRTVRGDENLYIYRNGYLQNGVGESIIREKTKEMRPNCKKRAQTETIEHVKTSTFVNREELGLSKKEIVVENGILNLETRELRKSDPKENPLVKIPARYDPDAECPRTLQFLNDIFREEDILTVQELIGYCLWKDYPIHKAFILLGEGANGKTTFINLLNQFLGQDNVSSRTLHDLIYDQFSKVYLYGKLANLTAETPTTKLSQADAFKRLTGKDPIKAEKKYHQPFFFRNFAKLVFAANELPVTEDMTYAFFRRWTILEFPHRFTGDPNDDFKDEDPNILEKICSEEEFSGLLNWALKGLNRILREGEFTESKSQEEIEELWIKQTDSIRAFVDDVVEIDESMFVTKGEFYDAYKDYCNNMDASIETKQKMGHRLPTIVPETTNITPQVDGKRQKSWANVRLINQYEKHNRDKGPKQSNATDVTSSSTTVLFKEKVEKDKSQNIKEGVNNAVTSITRLLSDGMGRSAEDISDELDIELSQVEGVLDELYDEEVVEKGGEQLGGGMLYRLIDE